MTAETTTTATAETPATLSGRVIRLGQQAIDRELYARLALAARMANPAERIHPDDMRTVMIAAAEAKPWRAFLEAAKNKDALTVLMRFRARLTDQLITSGPQNSTCPVRTVTNLIEQDGERRFLSTTAVFVDFE